MFELKSDPLIVPPCVHVCVCLCVTFCRAIEPSPFFSILAHFYSHSFNYNMLMNIHFQFGTRWLRTCRRTQWDLISIFILKIYVLIIRSFITISAALSQFAHFQSFSADHLHFLSAQHYSFRCGCRFLQLFFFGVQFRK